LRSGRDTNAEFEKRRSRRIWGDKSSSRVRLNVFSAILATQKHRSAVDLGRKLRFATVQRRGPDASTGILRIQKRRSTPDLTYDEDRQA
jgi:hypothetical protein